MYYVSDKFALTIKNSHNSAAKIEVRDKTGLKILANSVTTKGLNLIDGSVSVKRSDGARRSLQLNLQLTYAVFDRYLDPILGYRIYVYRGIKYDEDQYEWCPLGVFRITSASIRDDGGTVTYDGSGTDLSDVMAENLWTAPYDIPTGTNYATALQALFANRMPDIATNCVLPVVTETAPHLTFTEKDSPWQMAQKLAQGFAAEAYFDQVGVFTATLVDDPLIRQPVMDITENRDSVRITPMQTDFQLSETYNGVICRATAPWLLFPVEGTAWDDDATSPTYRYGPLGEKPKVIEDAMVSTIAQCQASAKAELYKIQGQMENISFTNICDPRFDVGDVVRVLDRRRGLTSVHVLDSLNIPLRQSEMDGMVRTISKKLVLS